MRKKASNTRRTKSNRHAESEQDRVMRNERSRRRIMRDLRRLDPYLRGQVIIAQLLENTPDGFSPGERAQWLLETALQTMPRDLGQRLGFVRIEDAERAPETPRTNPTPSPMPSEDHSGQTAAQDTGELYLLDAEREKRQFQLLEERDAQLERSLADAKLRLARCERLAQVESQPSADPQGNVISLQHARNERFNRTLDAASAASQRILDTLEPFDKRSRAQLLLRAVVADRGLSQPESECALSLARLASSL